VTGLARILQPVDNGWAIRLPDGRELARFSGANAKRRALRYVVTHDLAKEAAAHAERGAGSTATRAR
jgi:hypothetical protein